MSLLSWTAQAAWERTSSSLLQESCPNGYYDPGETNQVQFTIKNTSGGDLEEVQVELLPDGASLGGGQAVTGSNVDFVLTAKTDKQTVTKDSSISPTFTFRIKGNCGRNSFVHPLLLITWKNGGFEYVNFVGDKLAHNGQLGATVQTPYSFTSNAPITINDLGNGDHPGTATPYPASINASGVPNNLTDDTGERIVNVAVTLKNVTHPTQTEVGALLVGPRGQKVVLFRSAGNPVGGFLNTTFTISGFGSNPVPLNAPIQDTLTYNSADYGSGSFFGSAPAAPYNPSLDAFKSTPEQPRDPNGAWNLYIIDSINNGGGASGAVAGGWTLTLTTEKIVCCNGGETTPSITQYRDGRPNPNIAEVTIPEDTIFNSDEVHTGQTKSPLVSFEVSDLQTDPDNISVSGVSGDETKIKSSNIKIATTTETANGIIVANRTMEFRTEPNANGSVPVTIVATDASGRSSSATFNLKINSINDLPTFPNPVRNQAVNVGQPTPPLPFTVADAETPADQLVLTATSLDPTVVPDSNIVLTGNGANWTVTVIPILNSSARIKITATDRDGGVGRMGPDHGADGDYSFRVDFTTPANYPTISPFDPLTTKEDESKSVGFNLRSGSSTPVDSLALTVSSSNPSLVPVGNVAITGSGTERTLTVTPVANINSYNPANGTLGNTATITVTATDSGRSSSQSFVVTVTPVNDKPTITIIPAQIIPEDSETSVIPFKVFDVETANGQLTVSGRSSNPGLVPTPNVTIDGKVYGVIVTQGLNAEDRNVKIVPLRNAFGRATIFLDVTDIASQGVGPDTTVGSFPLEVQPVNDAPSINTINGNPLATNSDDAPLVKGDITEDTGVTDADHIAAQTLVLGAPVDDPAGGGIYPGVKPSLGPLNEVEQTVTLSATLDSTSIISSVFFDPVEDGKVKYPKTSTNLRYKLVPNAYGEVTVTLTLTDNGTGGLGGDSLSTVRKFKLRVNPANDAPSLKATPPTANLAHGQAIVIPIEVKDIETAAKNMTITATSTDLTTVPVANIIADPGQGIVTIIPIAPQDLGDRDVTISLAATDRGPKDDGSEPKLTTSPSLDNKTIFTLHFRNLPINHPPVLSDLTPNTATIQEDGVATSNVTISDPDGSGDVNGAVLSATSSDANILPGSNVLFGGTGANRSIAFVPAKDKNGSVTLSIVATDPGGFSSVAKKFDLTIVAVEDAPTVAVTRSTGDNTPWSGSVISANEDVSVVADVKTASGLIEVKVADAETPADQLVVEATSNNQNLVPNANITVSATGGTRTLSIKPVANRSGDAIITIKVKDANGTKVNGDFPLDTFTVRINQVNDAPTLNNPVPSGTTVVAKNAPPQSLSLTGITAGPEEGGQATNPSVPAQILTLKATAINKGSNPDDHKNDFMIPISGTDVIQAVFSGTGSATATATTEALTGLLTFQPKPNVFGTSTITVTVTDNGGTDRGGVNSTKISFDVVIGDANTAPTISIPSNSVDLTIPPGSNSPVIPITVNDASNETPPNELKLSFVSSNPALVPNSPESFTETGSGSNRGVIIKPLANAFGSANITVTVTDKGKADGSDVKSASQTIKLSVVAGPNPVVSPIADVTTHVNQDTDIIPFTVTDAQTPADQLVINATSDNQSVIPDFNIQLGGSGSNRALIIRPAQDRSGVATIRVTARDADNNIGFTTFKLTVLGQAPTISTIPDKLNLATGGSTGPLPFTVSDKETFAGFLTVTASSSNKNLVPDANIFLGGTGENRTVNVALAPGLTGNSTITLTVKDGEGQTATSTFKVGTTAAANTPPTISSIANVNTKVGDNIPIIGFTVGDVETAPADLKVTAVSSNPALITSSGIFLGGTGAARSLLLNPVKDKTGSTTITVTVADGGGATTSTGFTVNISSVAPVGVKNDFNGDGTQDIILQDNGGFLAAWYMSGDDVLSTSFLTPNNVGDLGWKVVGAGDFDNDSKTDLLFQHTDGSLAVWKLNGVNLSASVLLNPATPGAGWKAVATGDFNKDGKVDILFQHTDGTLAVWYMDGVNLAAVAPLNPNNAGPGWTVVGTGDINGDTNLDVVFQHTDGSLAVWYLTGNVNLLLPALLTPSNPGDQNWRAVGTIDLNGDKKTDILFQNRADNTIAVWYMNQATLVLGKLLNPANPGGTWQVVAP